MGVTHNDPVVTESKLTDFYNGIKPFLGVKPYMAVEDEGKSSFYSTTEKVVGRWVNNKPLYQKTIECGALPNNTVKSIYFDMSDIEKIINIEGYAYRQSGNASFLTLPYTTANGNYQIQVDYNANLGNNIRITTSVDLSAYTESYITVSYTKKSDIATTVSIESANDYSTAEKVVGSWIDGKPVYQKTLSVTSPAAGTTTSPSTKTYSIGASIDTVVDYNAYININGVYVKIFTINGSAADNQCFNLTIRTNSVSSDKNSAKAFNYTTAWSSLPLYITIQYTKTSD